MVEGLTATLHSQGLSVADATRQAYGRVAQLLEQQAAALAYKDVISVLAVLIACLIPMAFIMKRPAAGAAEAPPMH
ncbi:MAG TPA: hypothetical protein VK795_05975, partial [Terriglobales bacterium]|nr:hypothetical protein [Terriglobales bacterium]